MIQNPKLMRIFVWNPHGFQVVDAMSCHAMPKREIFAAAYSITRMIEILGSFCFSDCKSLSSISFESNSLLQRFESFAFCGSSLTSIFIPRTVEIVDGLAFSGCERLSISTEEGREHLVVEGHLLQNFDRSILIRYFGYADFV
jgi:hypothetical protein